MKSRVPLYSQIINFVITTFRLSAEKKETNYCGFLIPHWDNTRNFDVLTQYGAYSFRMGI